MEKSPPGKSHSYRDIVVVGASAGGIEALRTLLSDLPVDLEAAVLVVLHLPSGASSALPSVLSRASTLPVLGAVQGMPLRSGQVIVAVPDHHLIIRDGLVHLSRRPPEHGHRPGVDPLFLSAARWHGRRVIGIILSGALDDGAAGVRGIHRRGGAVLVQHPHDASHPGMPAAAVRAVPEAEVLALHEIGQRVVELASSPQSRPEAGIDEPDPDVMLLEAGLDPVGSEAAIDLASLPARTELDCPECQAVLWEATQPETGLVRYRCRRGHVWTPEALSVELDEELEGALWMALRALEERAALDLRGAVRAQESGRAQAADVSARSAQQAAHRADLMRGLLGPSRREVPIDHGT